jgi:hypothetical protein
VSAQASHKADRSRASLPAFYPAPSFACKDAAHPVAVGFAVARIQCAGNAPGVLRLDEVRKVDKIPVLGTGKTDYKVLRALIEK